MHEPCFAVTIHKSQGSEFSNVVIVVPDSETSAELLYTGVTRGRDEVQLLVAPGALSQLQSTPRVAGLAARLRKTNTMPGKAQELDTHSQLALF